MVLVIVVIPLFATVIIVLHNEFWWYCPLFDNRDNFNKSKQTVMWPKWKLNYKAPLIIVSLYNKAWITISFYVLHTGYSGVSHLGLNSICMNNCNWKGYYLATWRVKGTLVSIRERILLFRGGWSFHSSPPPLVKRNSCISTPVEGNMFTGIIFSLSGRTCPRKGYDIERKTTVIYTVSCSDSDDTKAKWVAVYWRVKNLRF